MPTAGRLVAAILFAGLFWYVSTLILPRYVELQLALPRWFMPINVGFGIIFGWRIAGSRAGAGTWAGAVSYGLTTAIAIAVAALFLHAFILMIEMSMRRAYAGPVEALIGVFELMYDGALVMGTPQVLMTMLAGGAMAGLLTEWTGRNFR